jgi:DNA-binding PucR family transcriptional regulator
LLADPDRAQRFAHVVLGPLAEDSPEAERLRETLRAYFACQESKAAASTELRVHQKTVAYRLRRAAELLGGSVEARKTELDAALMILDTLR